MGFVNTKKCFLVILFYLIFTICDLIAIVKLVMLLCYSKLYSNRHCGLLSKVVWVVWFTVCSYWWGIQHAFLALECECVVTFIWFCYYYIVFLLVFPLLQDSYHLITSFMLLLCLIFLALNGQASLFHTAPVGLISSHPLLHRSFHIIFSPFRFLLLLKVKVDSLTFRECKCGGLYKFYFFFFTSIYF